MNKDYLKAKAKVLRVMRPIILERDKNRCIICQGTEKLETAHYLGLAKNLKNKMRIKTRDGSRRFHKVEPLSWEELNHQNNLVALCNRCHAIYDERWWNVPEIKALYITIRHLKKPDGFFLSESEIEIIDNTYSEIEKQVQKLKPESERIEREIQQYLSALQPEKTEPIKMVSCHDWFSIYENPNRITWVGEE